MREAWATGAQKSRWIKTGSMVLILFILFLWMSPSGPSTYVPVSNDGNGKSTTPAQSVLHTDKCTKSHSADKPLVQYVLMVDAGSTGSRIHVYKFNNCGPAPELEKEEFKMTEKSVGGLSNFKDDPIAAAASLDPLLKVAMDTVPDDLKGCSPIAVKATAGLRRIGTTQAQAILDQVRLHLTKDYPFPVVSEAQGGVAVMDGSDEGVYAWITTNYLLGKVGGPDKGETAAVFDLGGGSTQIVFEPTFGGAPAGGMPEKLAPGDHKYELKFSGHTFDLYQHSHLGYGLMAARESIHQTLIEDLTKSKGTDKSWMTEPVTHPCIAPGVTKDIPVKVGEQETEQSFKFTGPTRASPALCRNLAEKILHKDADCKLSPCSFNGVYQPSIAKTFAKEDVFIFSYFYDRLKPLGMPDSFTLKEMHELTQKVCTGGSAWDVFSGIPGAIEELKDRPEHCLDLNFMLALLHKGYDMPMGREVKIAKKMKGYELGWCLGASLPLLSSGSGWECKIKEKASG